MKILGIDTAIPEASVALVEDSQLIVETVQCKIGGSGMHADGQMIGNHAEIILPLIQLVLNKAQSRVKYLSAIGLSIGPGSFTGLRIGLATVKGLAYGADLAMIGISTLQAHAARVNDFDGLVGCMLDARKGEVYFALFRREGVTLARITADAALSIESAIELLRIYQRDAELPLLLIGDGAKAHQRQLRAALGDALRLSADNDYGSAAAQVALLAGVRMAAGSVDNAGDLGPVYLRLSEAETKRKFLP
ncbi:MAG: tRNA (adenosine(37)-N6)-threonylcarbamoyltransferase complex dimerization subunit type 1 TsaB [Chloroflexota bacterium]